MEDTIEYLMVGAFPGYIWGWFQLPDYNGFGSLPQFISVYLNPITGAVATILLYAVLKKIWPEKKQRVLTNLFAATAIACYYWFRVPQLLGLSGRNTNGILIDLSGSLPAWTKIIFHGLTTVFFYWWLVIRKAPRRNWAFRPAYAESKSER